MVIRFALLKIGEVLGLWVLYVIVCLVGEFTLTGNGWFFAKNALEMYVLCPIFGVWTLGVLMALGSIVCTIVCTIIKSNIKLTGRIK